MNEAITGIIVFAVTVILAVVNSRSAYRNGIADGWRARGYPRDPLWRRKVKPEIDRYWPAEWARAEDKTKEPSP